MNERIQHTFWYINCVKTSWLFPLSIAMLIAHTLETPYLSLFIVTNKAKTMLVSSLRRERKK